MILMHTKELYINKKTMTSLNIVYWVTWVSSGIKNGNIIQ